MSDRSQTPIRPPRLAPGDTIGIVAPAGIVDRRQLRAGISQLKKLGFELHVPDQVYFSNGYLAGSDRQRADTINAAIGNPDVNAIICARGGYGCTRILDLIDYAAMRDNPKLIVGFSDVTALLVAAYVRSGLVTIHGPVVTSLSTADHRTIVALDQILSGEQAVALTASDGLAICTGVGEGPVLAGNLTLLCHLIGTPFVPAFSGHILLLEDLGEARYRIDRMLTHLALAGCFEGVAGIALGTFKDCGSSEKLHALFHERFRKLGIPVVAGFDIGHARRNLPVPIGLRATLDAEQGILAYDSAATCES